MHKKAPMIATVPCHMLQFHLINTNRCRIYLDFKNAQNKEAKLCTNMWKKCEIKVLIFEILWLKRANVASVDSKDFKNLPDPPLPVKVSPTGVTFLPRIGNGGNFFVAPSNKNSNPDLRMKRAKCLNAVFGVWTDLIFCWQFICLLNNQNKILRVAQLTQYL